MAWCRPTLLELFGHQDVKRMMDRVGGVRALVPMGVQGVQSEDAEHRAHLTCSVRCCVYVVARQRLVAFGNHIVDLGECLGDGEIIVESSGESLGPLAEGHLASSFYHTMHERLHPLISGTTPRVA